MHLENRILEKNNQKISSLRNEIGKTSEGRHGRPCRTNKGTPRQRPGGPQVAPR